jgi:hypothetical protein
MTDKAIHCPDCGCEISGDYMSADKSRRYFFAALRDAWANLPDQMRDRFPNAEVLRKNALIAIGYCDVMTVVAGSKAAAPQIANAFKARDQYCIAIPRGDVVTIYTARSMARRVLLKKDFLQVADKVFHWVHEQTGIDPSQSHEGRAAA